MARMNSRAMRAWATLEIAAELYRRQMFNLGSAVTLSVWSSKEEETSHPPLRLGVGGEVMGGMLAPIEVGKRHIDVAYVNPSAIVTMAYRGKGFYKRKLPLRALGSFPSWDKIAFAVSKDLKIKSSRSMASRSKRCSSGEGESRRSTIPQASQGAIALFKGRSMPYSTKA